MATPSYTMLVSGVITRLQQDNRLDAIPDANVYFGVQPNIPSFPSITVELQEAQDVWRMYPTNKDIVARMVITVMDRSMAGYSNGLKSVEAYVRSIDDVLHTDPKISGICYDSQSTTRRFSAGVVNDTPVFACEMDLTMSTRYASR